MSSQLTLVIRPRYRSGEIASYRFRVLRDARRDKGTTIFNIPARLHWNEQLKRDITESISDVLKEVYSPEEIDTLQAQAWELMQGIHS